jgi:hypothetical protein
MRTLTQLDSGAQGEDTMRLLPLSQWKCDACGQIVARPEMGGVEWLAGPTCGTKAHAFRLVHTRD